MHLSNSNPTLNCHLDEFAWNKQKFASMFKALDHDLLYYYVTISCSNVIYGSQGEWGFQKYTPLPDRREGKGCIFWNPHDPGYRILHEEHDLVFNFTLLVINFSNWQVYEFFLSDIFYHEAMYKYLGKLIEKNAKNNH